MANFTVIDNTQDKEKEFQTREAAEDTRAFLAKEGHDVELVDGNATNGQDVDAEVVDNSAPQAKQTAAPSAEPAQDRDDYEDIVLRENPLDYLEKINPAFVNTIKGTRAISKRGFRYMQVALGISTTSEIVQVFENPRGIVVHARAELPDGRYAEALGEGYAEGDVDANEFARYADTRAKNRAISDLTSSGALAESEL